MRVRTGRFMRLHYGLSIALGERDEEVDTRKERWSLLQILRRYSFAVAILSNFVIFPTVAIYIHEAKRHTPLLSGMSIVLSALMVLFFIFWFLVQYHNVGRITAMKRGISQQGVAADDEDAAAEF